MTFINFISAIGNNKSIYPLIIRDCGIEVPTKITMTYLQNKNDKKIAYMAARERFLDEYSVSAVWLGAIPFIDKIGKFLIQKIAKLDPEIDVKLLDNNNYQNITKNIELFKDKAPDEVKKLIKIKNNQKLYKSLINIKFLSSIIIPIILMGFVIPKLIFASTAKKMKQYEQNKKQFKYSKNFGEFQGKSISFGSLSNMKTVYKMAITDGGYAIGRIITARKKNEAIDIAFKMSGMMFLNFIAPIWIEKLFNKITSTNLDVKLLTDKRFLALVKSNKLNLPKINSEKEILDFIDNNPNDIFTKLLRKYGKVKFLNNGIRDPKSYVNIDEIVKFEDNIANFIKKSGKNVKNCAQKSFYLRSFTILANVALSSFLLAYCLPKAQFKFREWFTGSKLEPGLTE